VRARGAPAQLEEAARIRRYWVTPAIRLSKQRTAKRRGPELGVRDQLWLDELNDLTARFERAGPDGEDVLHPLHV
jgi:hypothetical protein